jgi:hypothetical protein
MDKIQNQIALFLANHDGGGRDDWGTDKEAVAAEILGELRKKTLESLICLIQQEEVRTLLIMCGCSVPEGTPTSNAALFVARWLKCPSGNPTVSSPASERTTDN